MICTRVKVRATLQLAGYRQSVRHGDRPLETHDLFFFSNEHLRPYSSCNILFDMKMILSFAIDAGPRQRSYFQVRVPRDSTTFYFSDSRFSQLGGPGLRIYIPPGTGWTSCTPRHWVPFSSPPATLRALVEVKDLWFSQRLWRDITPCRPLTVAGLHDIVSHRVGLFSWKLFRLSENTWRSLMIFRASWYTLRLHSICSSTNSCRNIFKRSLITLYFKILAVAFVCFLFNQFSEVEHCFLGNRGCN
jgi:hypothetical protein